MLKKHRLPRLVRLDVFSCAFLEMTKVIVSKAYASVARPWPCRLQWAPSSNCFVNVLVMAQLLGEGHDGWPAPSEQKNLSRHDVMCIPIVDLLLKPSGIHRFVKWC